MDKQGPTTTSEAKKIAGLSDDEDEDDDDKYADAADMPGQHVNQKTRTTIRNLRYFFRVYFNAKRLKKIFTEFVKIPLNIF